MKNANRFFTYLLVFIFGVVIGITGYRFYERIKDSRTGDISDVQPIDRGPISDATSTEDSVDPADNESTPVDGIVPITPEISESLNEPDTIELFPFEMRFFEVGEADSAIVSCDGHYMLVDGGYPKSSSLLYSYLQRNDIDYIDYIVCTHVHEDHVGGLAGALNYAMVGTAYAPVSAGDTRSFQSFIKYLGIQGKSITIPKAGDIFSLGDATVEIVAPIDMTLAESNTNNSSIVLRITYGDTSFLLMGDAETEEERSILDAGCNIKSTVLKVGHHGSSTSTSLDFLTAVSPEDCVISTGINNSYGHPNEDVLERIDSIGATIYRTDLDGDIICMSDGKKVEFIVYHYKDQ